MYIPNNDNKITLSVGVDLGTCTNEPTNLMKLAFSNVKPTNKKTLL